MSTQAYLLILNPNRVSTLKLKPNDRLFINTKTTKGHPKIEEEYFKSIQPGDTVYFSEGEPSCAIMGVGVVLKGVNKNAKATKTNPVMVEGIEVMFKHLTMPIPYLVINNLGIFKINGLDKHLIKGLKEERLLKINDQQEREINRLASRFEVAEEVKTLFVNNLLHNMKNLIEISFDEELSSQYRQMYYSLRETYIRNHDREEKSYIDEDVRDKYIKQGYHHITTLHSNYLSGAILAKDGEVMIPINPGYNDDQKEFEEDLRGLIKQILDIKAAMGLNKITLLFKFSPDAKLRLPEWLFPLCEEHGIRIQDITEVEDVKISREIVDTDDVPL